MNTLPFKTHKSLKTYYWSMLSWLYKYIISKIFWRDIADEIAQAWTAGYDSLDKWYNQNGFIYVSNEIEEDCTPEELNEMIKADKKQRDWLRDQEIM